MGKSSPPSSPDIFFFFPSACCKARVAKHFLVQSCRVPPPSPSPSSGCRAAALPGDRGRTRGAGPAGSRAGWGRRPGGRAGGRPPSLPPRLLPAPGRAGRPRGWEAAVLLLLCCGGGGCRLGPRREPGHLAELPARGRDLSPASLPACLPAAGAGAGRAGKLFGVEGDLQPNARGDSLRAGGG